MAIDVFEAVVILTFNDQGDGTLTATVGAVNPAIKRPDGSKPADDDVLSVQRDGSLQTRPAGSNGSFERCRKSTSSLLAFQPDGWGHRLFLVPFYFGGGQ